MADPQRGLLVSLLVLALAAFRGGIALPPPASPLSGAAAAAAAAAALSSEDPKEPSCDQLRAMWRFSKRQSRAAQMSNEIPTYRDPFAYPLWDPRPAAPGLNVQDHNNPRMGSFRNGRRFVYATQMRQSPRFTADTRSRNSALRELTNIIKMERARELQQQRLAEQMSSSRTRIYKKPSYGEPSYGQVVDGPVSALDLVRLEGMSKDPTMSMGSGGGEVVKRDPESVDYLADSVDLRESHQERRVNRNV